MATVQYAQVNACTLSPRQQINRIVSLHPDVLLRRNKKTSKANTPQALTSRPDSTLVYLHWCSQQYKILECVYGYVFVCVDLLLCMSSSQKWWTCCGPGCWKTTRRTGDESTRYGYSLVCRCARVVSALSCEAHVCIVLSRFIQAEPCACMIEPVGCTGFRRSSVSV